MLATAAAAAASRRWLPAFALVFGVWDLTFYAWLYVLIHWPGSLFSWDLLFLVPVPWTGPVLAPAIVSVSLIAGGILAMRREPERVLLTDAVLLVAGGAIVILAFIWNWRVVVAGALPASFPWAIFAAGELLGILGLIGALKQAKAVK